MAIIAAAKPAANTGSPTIQYNNATVAAAVMPMSGVNPLRDACPAHIPALFLFWHISSAGTDHPSRGNTRPQYLTESGHDSFLLYLCRLLNFRAIHTSQLTTHTQTP